MVGTQSIVYCLVRVAVQCTPFSKAWTVYHALVKNQAIVHLFKIYTTSIKMYTTSSIDLEVSILLAIRINGVVIKS